MISIACGTGGYFPLVLYGFNTYMFQYNYTFVGDMPFTFVTNELNTVVACKY
jgi:hypothetical protein